MCERMNVMTCVSFYPWRDVRGGPNVCAYDSARGICVLLSLQKPVLCVCFHASLCVVWRFREYACASMFTPLLAVALNLCRPIFYRGLLQSKMQIPHEFLIHCMPWLSHRGSQRNLG